MTGLVRRLLDARWVCQVTSALQRFWATVKMVYLVKLGFFPRFFMVLSGIGLCVLSMTGGAIMALIGYLIIAQIALIMAFHRGRQAMRDDCSEQEAMRRNSQHVALEDLADLAERYDIPPAEVAQVIRRGFPF